MGQLNIKSDRAAAAAARLASITGESMTQAVTTALEERLSRLDAAKRGEYEALMALGRHCAANMAGPPMTQAEMDDMLYDPETGLPR